MKAIHTLTLCCCLLHLSVIAQVRSMNAVKTSQSIKIDGNLDDAGWQSAPPATNFIISYPSFGKASAYKTEVKILYDNSAVYVGAYLYDTVSRIRKQLTARDVIDRQDLDYFAVGLDTYHDRQNAFIFQVTAAGVQGDARQSESSGFDRSWDAVWESRVSIKPDGWVVEMRIPFSAIRFSKKEVQDWGIQFGRFTRRSNENATWSPDDPALSGTVNKWGDWTGLRNIDPPLRLSFLPYLSGGVRVSPTAKGDVTEILKSGGMDVKYGINESFTVDMTLVPDFAQVQSDNVFLNLSPFEVKFDDYRPFFTEGTELFQKAGLFYSRRIGATPQGANDVLYTYGNTPDYKIEKNPGITRLYNATKFSGRTKSNLGIGVLNAVSSPMYARLHNNVIGTDSSILTEPLTNYNIIVLDQSLKNRSSITFTNTNVLRKGNSRNANVSSINLSLYDKRNLHNFSFGTNVSNVWGNLKKYNGYTSGASFAKVSGLWRYRGTFQLKSDQYDQNDLGFQRNNNTVSYYAAGSYNQSKQTRHFINHSYSFSVTDNYLYRPYVWTELSFYGNTYLLFKNFWDLSFQLETKPFFYNDYFIKHNYYTGRFLKRAPYVYAATNGSTDSRKKCYVNWNFGLAVSPRIQNDDFFTNEIGVRYRFSDKFQLSADMTAEMNNGNWGWTALNDANGNYLSLPEDSIIISRKTVRSNTSVLSAQYNFNSKMNINIRLRHNWSLVHNKNFYTVNPDGNLTETVFYPGNDQDYNQFNVDMFYTWDFLPGSRISIAWKNALGGNANFDPYVDKTYFRNVDRVFNNPHSNEVTCKIVYYFDYLRLKKKH